MVWHTDLLFAKFIYYYCKIINKLVTLMDRNLDIGLIMPKVLNPVGSIQMLCKFFPRPIDLFTSKVRGPGQNFWASFSE